MFHSHSNLGLRATIHVTGNDCVPGSVISASNASAYSILKIIFWFSSLLFPRERTETQRNDLPAHEHVPVSGEAWLQARDSIRKTNRLSPGQRTIPSDWYKNYRGIKICTSLVSSSVFQAHGKPLINTQIDFSMGVSTCHQFRLCTNGWQWVRKQEAMGSLSEEKRGRNVWVGSSFTLQTFVSKPSSLTKLQWAKHKARMTKTLSLQLVC